MTFDLGVESTRTVRSDAFTGTMRMELRDLCGSDILP